MSKAQTALSGDELRKELKTIDAIHELLFPLSPQSRFRVLNWLESWARFEADPHDRGSDF